MSKLVTIAAVQMVAEADLIKSTLEEHGLEVYLADDNLIAMDWLLSNAVGGVKVQVAAKDAEAAREIVEQIQKRKPNDAPPVVFDCQDCGQRLEFPGLRRGGVETCPRCGSYVDVPE